MYLYNTKSNQEFFQNSIYTNLMYKSFSAPLGKTLSELINFDYSKLTTIFTKSINGMDHTSTPTIISDMYRNISRETKWLIEDLYVPLVVSKKCDGIEYIFELNHLLKEIKTLMQLDICKSKNIDFIKFYFQGFIKTKKLNKEMVERMTYLNDSIDFNNNLLFVKHKIKDGDLQDYITSLNIENENDIPDGDVLFNGLIDYINSAHKNNVIKKHTNTVYNIELLKYLKKRLKYEYNKAVDINSLSQLILISFINCCANNIKPARCEHCGNLYFKHGKSKYCCEDCLKVAKVMQKFNRNYTYIDSTGEKYLLNYDDILRNFESKVDKVIKYVKETNDLTDDKSRKIIINKLNDYKFAYRNERNNIKKEIAKSNNQNEKEQYYNIIAELLYEVKNLYNKRNSLKNAVKDSIEQSKYITLKFPKLCNCKIVNDVFIIDYFD